MRLRRRIQLADCGPQVRPEEHADAADSKRQFPQTKKIGKDPRELSFNLRHLRSIPRTVAWRALNGKNGRNDAAPASDPAG
jgi:hypothetical protein